MRLATKDEIAQLWESSFRSLNLQTMTVVRALIDNPGKWHHIALNEIGIPGNLDDQMAALEEIGSQNFGNRILVKRATGHRDGGYFAVALWS